ncbi:MAG: protein kinase [Planctomycetes bacterium]|nr:protein kinase [Planctomycetota bacterium]
MNSDPVTNPREIDRESCLTDTIEDVVRRRAVGDRTSDESIIAEHPELMPELADALQTLQFVEEAQSEARSRDGLAEGTVNHGEATEGGPTRLPPDFFPGYTLQGECHHGGQGVVYRAIQAATGRTVAIKVMHGEAVLGTHGHARFEREARILARLKHPNIVTVHDGGSKDGNRFLVMDWIAGQHLDTYMSSRQLPIEATLRLFGKICEAVNAAHLRGIIHRDLKPSNILVDEYGEPQVLDFGLAKSDADESTDAALWRSMTVTGQFVGSLPWSSPEQADGRPEQIDLRTDVYSLGVVMYQALTGRFPYAVTGSMRDTLRNIVEADPPRPGAIRKDINNEVETIVLKCLSKDPSRRYQTAGALADDIARYLSGDAIEAKRDSTLYVLRKQMRRHRVPLIFAAGVLLLIIASSVVAWTLYGKARASLWESYLAQARTHRTTGQSGQRFRTLAALREAVAIRPSIELRNEAIAAMALPDIRMIDQMELSLEAPQNVAFDFSTDGDRVWVYEIVTGVVTVLEYPGGRTLLTLPAGTQGVAEAPPRFSRDGRLIAVKSKTGFDVWDIEGGRAIKTIPARPSFGDSFDFSPNGNEIAIGTDSGEIFVASLATDDTRILPPLSSRVQYIRYNPTGDLLATSSFRDSFTLIRDALTGDVRCNLNHSAFVRCLAWSQDGGQLATGCGDNNVYVWDARTGARLHALSGHMGTVSRVDFGGKGATLLSSSWDGTTRLWDIRRGIPLVTIPATAGLALDHRADILRFVKREPKLILATAAVAVDDAFEMIVGDRPDSTDPSTAIYIGKNSRWAITGSQQGFRIWDIESRRQVRFVTSKNVGSIGVHPQESELVTCGSEGVVRWPLDLGQNTIRIGPPEAVASAHRFHECAYTMDGESLVAANYRDGEALVYPTGDHGEPRRIGSQFRMSCIAVSPKNNWLATATFKGKGVKIWDLTTGDLVESLSVEGSAYVDFSPAGKWLAAGGGAGIEIWDTGTWKTHGKLARSSPRFLPGPIAFSSDGRLLAFGDSGPPLKLTLVDPNTLKRIAILECPGDIIVPQSLSFTPDGTRLLFPHPGQGNVLCIWNLRAVREQLAAMDLDWDLPPYPAPVPTEPALPLHVEIDLGDFAPGT